jgi:methane/ammonia monooxygenase subunit C
MYHDMETGNNYRHWLARPLHWGFVILGWSGLFAGGIAAQMITRFSNLTDVVWNHQSKIILNRI